MLLSKLAVAVFEISSCIIDAERQLSTPVKRELPKLRFSHPPFFFAPALNTANLACKPNEKFIPGAAFLHVNHVNLLG